MSCFIILLNVFVSVLTIIKLSLEIFKTFKDKKRNANGGNRKRKK